MDCREARRRLWPADVLRVSDAEVEAALEHAEACQECSRFLEADRRVARLIREHVPRLQAPRALRERLYTALARERAGSPEKWPESSGNGAGARGRILALAVMVLAALGLGTGGFWFLTQNRAESAATAFAEDYLRRVVEQEELRTGDRQEIAAFFARELGMSTEPPIVRDYHLQRASICMMNGRRGGVVEYERAGRQLTYYVIPREENPSSRRMSVDARRVRSDAGSASLAAERGLGVATWWDGEHQHALVGNMSAAELRDLAPLFGARRRP